MSQLLRSLEIAERVAWLEKEVAKLRTAQRNTKARQILEESKQVSVQETLPTITRETVIADAKLDVKELLNSNYRSILFPHLRHVGGIYFVKVSVYPMGDVGPYEYVDFVINKKKRTVVCLIMAKSSGVVRLRGVAKCAPKDCFNVHIGKAISLRRALGLKVPEMFTEAPQPKPEDMQPGDIVEVAGKKVKVFAVRPTHMTVGKEAGFAFNLPEQGFTYICDNGFEYWEFLKRAKIVDDSRDE